MCALEYLACMCVVCVYVSVCVGETERGRGGESVCVCVCVCVCVQDAIQTIGQLQCAANITETSLLNFCVSDGSCMVSTRFVTPETGDAASLYYAEGA